MSNCKYEQVGAYPSEGSVTVMWKCEECGDECTTWAPYPDPLECDSVEVKA